MGPMRQTTVRSCFLTEQYAGWPGTGPGQIAVPARFANNNSLRKVINELISAYEVPANPGSACGPEPRSRQKAYAAYTKDRSASSRRRQAG